MQNGRCSASGSIKQFLHNLRGDMTNGKLQITLWGTGASLEFEMKDLDFFHTLRLKLFLCTVGE